MVHNSCFYPCFYRSYWYYQLDHYITVSFLILSYRRVFIANINMPGHARAVMHIGIANPRWRGKRSRHLRRNFTYLARGPWYHRGTCCIFFLPVSFAGLISHRPPFRSNRKTKQSHVCRPKITHELLGVYQETGPWNKVPKCCRWNICCVFLELVIAGQNNGASPMHWDRESYTSVSELGHHWIR